jgi:hypothetical protein
MKVVIPDTKAEALPLQTHFPLLSVLQTSEWPVEASKNGLSEQNAEGTKFV